jgi:hypothetical protein
MPFWDQGLDVHPGVIYPSALVDSNRRKLIEDLFEDRWIQVVWADERDADSRD